MKLRPRSPLSLIVENVPYYTNSNKIDLLAARVAEVVRAEVNRFFEVEED